MRNSKLDFALLALAGFLAGLTFAPSRVLAGIIQAIVPQAVPIANKRGNSTVFQLASTNTAAANGTLLCQDALGNATSTGCFVPPGQLTYYMSDTASDVATYLQATQAPFSPKTQLDFTGIGNGTSTIQNWATVPGQPGIASIPAGLYSFHVHASKTAGANVSIQTQFWEVDATGVDIGLIGVSDATGNLTTSEIQYDMAFADGNTYTLASAASRIVARVQAVVTSGPGAAHIFVGGTADTHISIPNPGGGSGGGVNGAVGAGTYASTPACTTTNYLYKITSGILDSAVCDGASALSYFWGGHAITPAAALNMTSSLQSGVTVSSTNGYEVMTLPKSGSSTQSIRYWTAPAPPYVRYLAVYLPDNTTEDNYRDAAFGWTDGSGNNLFCRWYTNSGYAFDVKTGSTGLVGPINLHSIVNFPTKGLMLVKLADDGTNISLSVCRDTGSCIPIFTEARTTHITPSKLYYGGENSSSGGLDHVITLVGVF